MRHSRGSPPRCSAWRWISSQLARAAAFDPQHFAQIEKGRYLVTVADCAACHTNPKGGRPFAGGRPIETPFGIVAAANITPDRETGIGNWTDQQFDSAVRHGIRSDGSRLYPAMPFTSYTKMSRDEVLAIRAYLSTIAPANSQVRTNRLPFPLNIRAGMRVWDELYFDDGEFQPDDKKSAQWNRGAYLVTGPGHCGACHTPKNLLGGDKKAGISARIAGSRLVRARHNRRSEGRWPLVG